MSRRVSSRGIDHSRGSGRLASRLTAGLGVLALFASTLLWMGVGPAAADTVTASNTAAIAVPATGSANQIGPGSPYPSPITINGLTGTVSDVNVTLTSVTHAIATDMDVLLVGPAGQNLVLMSDVKSGTGFPINNATLTFDDQAAGTIPGTGALTTGTFRPTNVDDGPDTFPAPAPAPSAATALSAFNGTNPNGTWNLYTVDDATGDVGSIAGGWSITVTTDVVAQPGAIEFTATEFRGAEGGGPVALTLRRVGGADGAVGATVSTTTPATATPGIDFTPLSQTVSFADGQTTASVPLTVLNDTAVEGVDETVTVALSAPTGGATLGTPSTTVVRIDDNDATSDTTPITIPGTGTGGTTGAPATPYPASIHVTGQPALIGGVEVTLNGFSHAIPEDVDILLAGPGGLNVVLMSDVGGGVNPVSNLNLRFADSGAGTIPAVGPIVSGTYRVSDNDPGAAADNFPAPAPAPSTATSLAAFVGTNPNGVWSLYIVDDASGDTGSISGGWSLTFLPAVFPDAGGPYTVGEGQPVTLDGSASTVPVGTTFAWDVDNDGQFDDATGANPTVSAATLASLGLGDGPAGPVTVTLQVTSGATVRTDTTTLTVTNTPPTASVGSVPAGIVAGIPATLTFSATDPSAADTAAGFTYAVSWGDGTPVQSVTGGTSVSVAHTWATAGTFTVSVTATDKDAGTSAAATASVGVEVPVVADAGGPYTVAEGTVLTLDGSGSTASPTATYAWDVDGDGQFDDATGVGPTLTWAQLEALGLDDGPAGPLTVSLEITDGAQTASDSANLTITNTAPTASVGSFPTVIAGAPATFTFGAIDPSAADTTAGFTYTLNWGDGTPPQSVPGGTTLTASHTYATDGRFTVALTVADKDGGVGSASTSVTVLPVVVADAGGPYTVGEGQPLTLDGTGSTAPVGATYNWDLERDGIIDATGPNPTISAAYLQSISLGDGPAGPIQVTLQVLAGGNASVVSTTLMITNTPPTATVDSVPTGVAVGSAATITFGATDPSAADTVAFSYAIDWGDGSAVQSVTGGTSVDVTHTYEAAGGFTISVTATDKDGGTSAPDTGDITVLPVVNAGGPYSIAEGDDLVLDGSRSVAGPGAVFAWDLDGDGQFDDATGPSPTLSPADLAPLGLDDGPHGPVTFTLQVTVGPAVATATATYEISNVAPVATVQLSGPIVAGTPTTVKVGAEDPSPTDMGGQFEYRIDWEGDGVIDDVVTGPADPPVTHTYASAGDVGLSVVAVDKDGAASTPTVTSVTVSPAQSDDDGTDNGGTDNGGTDNGGDNDGGEMAPTGAEVTTLVLAAGALLLIGLSLVAGASATTTGVSATPSPRHNARRRRARLRSRR